MSVRITAEDRVEVLEQAFAALVRHLDGGTFDKKDFLHEVGIIANSLAGSSATGKAQAARDLHSRLKS